MPTWADDILLAIEQTQLLVMNAGSAAPLPVLFASLVLALVISSYDNFTALIYAVVAIQTRTVSDWMVITVVMLVYWLYKGVLRAVKS